MMKRGLYLGSDERYRGTAAAYFVLEAVSFHSGRARKKPVQQFVLEDLETNNERDL